MSEIPKPNVLIVDDQAANLRLLEVMLGTLDLEIIKARSGEEALNLAEKNDFALILMDVCMPEMDGFATAEKLRSNEKTKLIPIIFISAINKDEKHIFKGYDSGAVDYLFKPVDAPTLKCKVRIFLEIYAQKKLLQTEILERKRNEEKARAANLIKDKFISLVAHDLKTPFTTTLGLIKSVLDDQENPLNEGQKEVIRKAMEKGEGILGKIEELLKIGGLRTGVLKPKPSFIDISTTILFSTAEFDNIAKKKGIKFSNETPVGTTLYADSKLFMEVIKNLVSNAIKFSNKGSAVTIFIPPDQPTTIAVKDTGIGIGKEKIEGLLNHEVNSSTLGTMGEHGTGFGLLLCKDIMEAHGGTLDFESTPGEGSVFYARLPLVYPKILIVDDEEITRRLIKKILKTIDAEFIEAGDGMEAWEIVKNARPHLIIADKMMPLLDGFELLIKIRNDSDLENTPVIILTCDAKEETWKKAYQLKADDFIPKPIDADYLLQRVRKYV